MNMTIYIYKIANLWHSKEFIEVQFGIEQNQISFKLTET